jgi:hypothetical protein
MDRAEAWPGHAAASDPRILIRVTACSSGRELRRLARAIPNDPTSCSSENLLICPDLDHADIARALPEQMKVKDQDVRQTVPMMDDEFAPRAFHETSGLTEGGGSKPEPHRTIVISRCRSISKKRSREQNEQHARFPSTKNERSRVGFGTAEGRGEET